MWLAVTTLLLLWKVSAISASICPNGCYCDFDNPSILSCTLTGIHSTLPDVPSLNFQFQSIFIEGLPNNPLIISELKEETFSGWQTNFLLLRYIQIGTLTPGAFDGIGGLNALEISNSNIDDIPAGMFQHLTHLTSLDISSTNVWNVKADWFIGLEILSYLGLVNNKISRIEENAFSIMQKLKRLLLLRNNITDISNVGINQLGALTEIALGWNPLGVIPPSTFNSQQLTKIFLSFTLLTTLPCDAFAVQPSQPFNVLLQNNGITDLAALLAGGSDNNYCLPGSLNQIDLGGNPITKWPSADKFNPSSMPSNSLILTYSFICDCDLASGRRDFSRIVSDSLGRSCSSPSTVAGKRVLCFDPRLVPCSTLPEPCLYDPVDFQACASVDRSIQYPFRSPPNNISSVQPSEGSDLGGTKVTASGSGFNSYAIKSVHFGDQLFGQADNGFSTNDKITFSTPNSFLLDEPLPISFEFCFGVVLDTGYNFTFQRRLPFITDVQPKLYLTSGGMAMNIAVTNLDSIRTQFELQLSFTTETGGNSTISELCSMNASSSSVICIIPAFNCLSPVDISTSFRFDESDVLPPAEITYYPPPQFNRIFIKFDPTVTDVIKVTGLDLLRGCQQSDYIVTIGQAPCYVVLISKNQLICQPPSSAPFETDNSNCPENQVTLTIKIGYAMFQPACIEYSKPETTTDGYTTSVLTTASTIEKSPGGVCKTVVSSQKLQECKNRIQNMQSKLASLRRLQRSRKKG